jgi:hypothetical protein
MDVIMRMKKKLFDMVLFRVTIDNARREKLVLPASNVKHVCNKRLRVNVLPKRCI